MRSSLILAVLLGCQQRPPSRLLPAAEVHVAGCSELRVPRTCEFAPSSPLTLWVAGSSEARPPIVELDGRPIRALREPARVRGGLRLKIAASPGVLSVWSQARERQAPWRMRIATSSADPELKEIARLRNRGELELAEEKLARIATRGPRPGLAGQRARNARSARRFQEAIDAFGRSIAENVAAGALLSETRDRTALAHTLVFAHGYLYEEAAAALEPLDSTTAAYAEARGDYAFTRGQLAFELRDIRRALTFSREALAHAERLDLEGLENDTLVQLLGIWAFVGRWSEARDVLERLRLAASKSAPPCTRADLYTNIGWYSLLGSQHAPDLFPALPRSELRKAAQMYRVSCPDPDRLMNSELNLAWVELLASSTSSATAHLREARGLVAKPILKTSMDMLHLEGEIALQRGANGEALAVFAELQRLASRTNRRGMVWQALLGRGRTFERMGNTGAAITAFQEAERVLDDLSVRVPIGEGRDALLFERSMSSEHLVQQLLKMGRVEEAIDVSRRSRLRVLRNLEPVSRLHRERDRDRLGWESRLRAYRLAQTAVDQTVADDWRVPASERAKAERRRRIFEASMREALDAALLSRSASVAGTRAPLEVGRGEVAVVIHPVGDGAALLAQTDQAVRAATVQPEDGLQPIAGLIRGRTRVRFYVHAAFEQMDWHGVELDGRPLIERAVVEYVADLAPRGRVDRRGRRALVVADPTEALPSAKLEASRLARRLEDAELEVSAMIGSEVSRERIVRALEDGEVDLFHYAGHGFQDGPDGVGAGFKLLGGESFTVADVLLLRRVPKTIVLSACDLGRQGTKPGAPGLGLARAFLLAGAEQVVAAVRPVRDRSARAFIERFYDHWLQSRDAAEAIRAAQVEPNDPDAMAFRVFTRR